MSDVDREELEALIKEWRQLNIDGEYRAAADELEEVLKNYD